MLINLRNALMAGKRLPYDAEVEYLESTGTQWIDTGLLPSNDMAFESQAMVTGIRSGFSYTNITGSRSSSSSANQFSFTVSARDLNIGNFCGWGSYENRYADSREFDSQWHTWRYSKVGMWVDGENFLLFPSNVGITPTEGMTIWLFARRGDNSALQNPLIGRIRYATYSIGGVLVRDFIPVRVGTVGYLYDRVSGQLFGNAGTGDFVLGPDVVPVEYIESHGTEYIDTPWTPDLTTDMRISGRAGFATTNRGMLLSAYNSGSPDNVNISFELYSDLHFRVYAFADVFSRFKCADSIRQMFDYSIVYTALNGLLSCTANGIEASGTVLTQCRVVNTRPARLGADYRATNRYGLFGPVKVYNPGLIFDFTPVRVGTEGAMMDTITRRIYRNAGTGNFGYGNDLKYPIPAE